MLKINVITLFPNLFEEHLNNLPFKRAILSKELEVNLVNLRNYSLDNYGAVDDKPYGGGVGMILMVEPIYKALSSIFNQEITPENVKKGVYGRIIVLSPRGKTYKQAKAHELAMQQELTLICGRYEGIDARIEEYFATDVVSIGNYVLSGGELPALNIMESVTRLLPNVLQKDGATITESFSSENYIEYPQYTRPENFNGLSVPEVLLSGNHKAIETWRNTTSQKHISGNP